MGYVSQVPLGICAGGIGSGDLLLGGIMFKLGAMRIVPGVMVFARAPSGGSDDSARWVLVRGRSTSAAGTP